MAWQCRMIDKPKEFDDLQIGDMFYMDVLEDGNPYKWPDYWSSRKKLSEYYFQNNAHRRPIGVILPGHIMFVVDGKCWNEHGTYGGWTVTGEAPLITVSPSINVAGAYHGFLQNGVISDDVEGRLYDAHGRLIRKQA